MTSLDAFQDILLAIFSGAVAISTVVYAILTWKLVSETRKVREVQSEPKLLVTLESTDFAINIVRLCIKNIGLGPAKNIHFRPKVTSGDSAAENLLKEFTKPNFFRLGINHLGPGQSVYSGFSSMLENHDQKISSQFLFRVKYDGPIRKNYSEEFAVDMSELSGTSRLGEPYLNSITKSLEKIETQVRHIATGFNRIKVDVYSSEDRQTEYDKLMKEYEDGDGEEDNKEDSSGSS